MFTKMIWGSHKKEKAPVESDDLVVADGIIWKPLHAAITWSPEPGEVITGTFIGFQIRTGQYGEYRAVRIRVSTKDVYAITGTVIVRLFETIQPDSRVRVVFAGSRVMWSGNTLKLFRAFVAQNDVQKAAVG
jgi:hypothetical protein